MSAEAFYTLCDEEGFYGELHDGKAIEMTPPGLEHSGTSCNIYDEIAPFVKKNKLGRAFMDAGFVIEHNPDSVMAPDVAYISKERLPTPLPKNFSQILPDLAVEVVSPGDRFSEVRNKAERYLEAGVREVWVVDPRRQVVEVSRSNDTITLKKGETLETPVLPGFHLSVSEIFEQ
ncbi:MAG: Uma2 family endonuclease [Candidatus Sumerlaeota bacterium]|nr:Uma2 family endonuclease [Candidatus Sumerlaeota bacterium]